MFPAIKAFLLTSPAITALVASRIYPDSVPLNEPEPALSLFLVSTVYDDSCRRYTTDHRQQLADQLSGR